MWGPDYVKTEGSHSADRKKEVEEKSEETTPNTLLKSQFSLAINPNKSQENKWECFQF